MNKKTLIAIGVIAVLGIGTYSIIVSRNKNKNNDSSTGGTKQTAPTAPPSSTPTKNENLFCKYLKIGCGLSGRINL
jgi:flagellar basal body-associated protein FliL